MSAAELFVRIGAEPAWDASRSGHDDGLLLPIPVLRRRARELGLTPAAVDEYFGGDSDSDVDSDAAAPCSLRDFTALMDRADPLLNPLLSAGPRDRRGSTDSLPRIGDRRGSAETPSTAGGAVTTSSVKLPSLATALQAVQTRRAHQDTALSCVEAELEHEEAAQRRQKLNPGRGSPRKAKSERPPPRVTGLEDESPYLAGPHALPRSPPNTGREHGSRAAALYGPALAQTSPRRQHAPRPPQEARTTRGPVDTSVHPLAREYMRNAGPARPVWEASQPPRPPPAQAPAMQRQRAAHSTTTAENLRALRAAARAPPPYHPTSTELRMIIDETPRRPRRDPAPEELDLQGLARRTLGHASLVPEPPSMSARVRQRRAAPRERSHSLEGALGRLGGAPIPPRPPQAPQQPTARRTFAQAQVAARAPTDTFNATAASPVAMRGLEPTPPKENDTESAPAPRQSRSRPSTTTPSETTDPSPEPGASTSLDPRDRAQINSAAAPHAPLLQRWGRAFRTRRGLGELLFRVETRPALRAALLHQPPPGAITRLAADPVPPRPMARETAAVNIQRAARGMLGRAERRRRQEAAAEHLRAEPRESAARTIQRASRSWGAARTAAVRSQAAEAAITARVEDEEAEEESRRRDDEARAAASVQIQCAARTWSARGASRERQRDVSAASAAREEDEGRGETAATKLQSWSRGHLGAAERRRRAAAVAARMRHMAAAERWQHAAASCTQRARRVEDAKRVVADRDAEVQRAIEARVEEEQQEQRPPSPQEALRMSREASFGSRPGSHSMRRILSSPRIPHGDTDPDDVHVDERTGASVRPGHGRVRFSTFVPTDMDEATAATHIQRAARGRAARRDHADRLAARESAALSRDAAALRIQCAARQRAAWTTMPCRPQTTSSELSRNDAALRIQSAARQRAALAALDARPRSADLGKSEVPPKSDSDSSDHSGSFDMDSVHEDPVSDKDEDHTSSKEAATPKDEVSEVPTSSKASATSSKGAPFDDVSEKSDDAGEAQLSRDAAALRIQRAARQRAAYRTLRDRQEGDASGRPRAASNAGRRVSFAAAPPKAGLPTRRKSLTEGHEGRDVSDAVAATDFPWLTDTILENAANSPDRHREPPQEPHAHIAEGIASPRHDRRIDSPVTDRPPSPMAPHHAEPPLHDGRPHRVRFGRQSVVYGTQEEQAAAAIQRATRGMLARRQVAARSAAVSQHRRGREADEVADREVWLPDDDGRRRSSTTRMVTATAAVEGAVNAVLLQAHAAGEP